MERERTGIQADVDNVGRAYAAACRHRSYEELVAEHASKTKTRARERNFGHYWLKVSDLEALKQALDGNRDHT